jgi:hypothetical protein
VGAAIEDAGDGGVGQRLPAVRDVSHRPQLAEGLRIARATARGAEDVLEAVAA